jgi:hypothetical protein
MFLVLFGLLGIVLVLIVVPVYFLPAFLVAALLLLGADLIYIPHAFRAWKGQTSTGDP